MGLELSFKNIQKFYVKMYFQQFHAKTPDVVFLPTDPVFQKPGIVQTGQMKWRSEVS